MSSTWDFDPNKSNSGSWATYVPMRRGAAFKVHRTRGHATSAIVNAGLGVLYERGSDGRWVERMRQEEYVRECLVCGGNDGLYWRGGVVEEHPAGDGRLVFSKYCRHHDPREKRR